MKIGFYGCGNMGSAMARAFKGRADLLFFDRDKNKSISLAEELSGRVSQDLTEADLLFLAVKPAVFLAGDLPSFSETLVSPLAGVTLEQLEKAFPKARVIRAMPNLAVSLNKGAVALAAKGERKKIETLLSPLGKLFWVEESHFDTFTALAGSGPAFFFEWLKDLANAAKKRGLDPDLSYQAALQMVEGSLALLRTSEETPESWIEKVAVRGGATEAGLKSLQEENLADLLTNCIEKTANRSQELGTITKISA